MNHILFAYAFNDMREVLPLIGDEISREIKNEGLAWVHLDLNNPESHEWLKTEIAYLDPFILKALTVSETRPRIVQIQDGVLIILRGINLNEGSDPSDMVSIRIWIDKHRIISLQRRPVSCISELENAIKIGRSPRNAGEFICDLLTLLLREASNVIADLDQKSDDIETKIIAEPEKILRGKITDIRTETIDIRRYLIPQKEVIATLLNSNIDFLGKSHKRRLSEDYDNITRLIEDIESVRDRAHILKDELHNSLSEQLNKNLYLLSIMSTIFLPLGFLTGLFGINIGGLPGVENPSAFMFFMFSLFILIIFQIYLLKKNKII